MYTSDLEKNKAIILHFDKACIEQNDSIALNDLVCDEVINHATPLGRPNGKESFQNFLNALHTGLSTIKVIVLRQVAENDLVVTHKVISGIHSGNLFGLPATGNHISIEAIEIIRLQNGRYAEHWVQSNMAEILGNLQGH